MARSYRAISILAALSASLPTGGCCALARFFCGPDTSGWVSESWETPQAAVATFKEAVRRDDAGALYRCLSEGFKERKATGSVKLGSVEFAIVWERIKQEVPGTHMLGYAKVSEPQWKDTRHVRFTLEEEGYRVELELVRQDYWEFKYQLPERAELYEDGSFVGSSLESHVAVFPDEDEGTSELVIRLPDVAIEGLELDRIRSAGVGSEWKIDDIDSAGTQRGGDPDETGPPPRAGR